MSIVEIRVKVYQMIDEVDYVFLEVIYVMFEIYQKREEDFIVGYEVDGRLIMIFILEE